MAKRRTNQPDPQSLSHLHVVIPLEAHRRARIMAVRSGMLLKSYLAELLMQAEPLGPTLDDAPKEPVAQAAQGMAS